MKFSIIIPVFNEEATILECLKRVKKATLPKSYSKEIVVVNDGSEDNSEFRIQNSENKGKIKNLKIVSYSKNMGKGYAIRQGLKKATGDYVLIQDADLEYDPNDYKKLLKPIFDKKARVVYGSRFLGEHRNMFFWNMQNTTC